MTAKPKQPSLTMRVLDYFTRTPSVADAEAQLRAREAKLEELKARHAAALAEADKAAYAAAGEVEGAAALRDERRSEARLLREQIADLEVLIAIDRERLNDAETAAKRAADAALWREVDEIMARREQAGARADQALVELGEALRDVEQETELLARLKGSAVPLIGLTEVRANLRCLLGEKIGGYRAPLSLKPVAEVLQHQHSLVNRERP